MSLLANTIRFYVYFIPPPVSAAGSCLVFLESTVPDNYSYSLI